MTIDSLTDLKKVIKLCRENGVTSIEIDGIKLSLTSAPTVTRRVHKPMNLELPPEATMAIPQYTDATYEQQLEKIDVESFDSLSDEAKLFYSSRPEDTN